MSNQELNLSLHKKQTFAYQSKATEMLYGGAAGGGKSHLMRIAAIIWCAQIKGLQVYLFRRVSDDLYKNHMEGAGGFYNLLAPWFDQGLCKYNSQKNYISFWNGAKIWLCHCQYEKDMYKYQGAEIHVLMIDELTHFTEKIYRFLRGRCRLGELEMADHLKAKFPMILCGSNPSGVGHNWVKMTFVDNAPYGDIVRMNKEEGGMLRQYIPAVLADNPSVDADDYASKLEGLGSPDLVEAMLMGNWDIVSGGAFDDLWSKDTHIIKRFKVPKSWRVDRSFDWGSAHPFSVGWWAKSNGEEAYFEDGTVFCPPAGSLVRIAEWYGTERVGTNRGLKLGSEEIAHGILEREKALLDSEWIKTKPHAGCADNQIYNVTDKDTDTIAKKMEACGVEWVRSDKSAGSRINGLQLLRDRLRNSLKHEGISIYFTDNCRGAISTLPVLPRDEKNQEDVDTKAEDHVYDEVRYRVLHEKKEIAESIEIAFPT